MSTVHVDYPILTSTATGGSTILSVQLQWDAGSSGASWTTLIGFSPYSTTQTLSITGAQIIAGRTYKFKYRAFNIHGWGSYSDPVDILAASSPSQMNAVITSLVGVQVKIQWTPLSNNGSPISQYLLEFLASDGTTFVQDTLCDGTDSDVLQYTYCLIPMADFLSSPYTLTRGSLI